jgi:hypothetical protein
MHAGSATGTGAADVSVEGGAIILDADLDTISIAASGIAYVRDVAYTTESGAGEIEPMQADRGAWDALAYQARHANDIDNAAGIHHTLTGLDAIYLRKALVSGHIFVGNASNVAADVAMSGDVTIDNAGATTIGAKKVDASNIELANTKLLIGGADGAAHEQSMSADATIANTGALTLATVNANVGTFGDADNIAQVTVNAKGLVTAVTEVAIDLPVVPLNVYNEMQTADGTSLTYYLTNYAVPSTIRVYIDGIRQPASDDAAPTDEVIFTDAPAEGALLLFDYEMEQV